MKSSDLIYIVGHAGMVGSAIMRRLDAEGCTDLLLRTPDQLDLTDPAAVQNFFTAKRPDYVFLASPVLNPSRTDAITADGRALLAYQRNIIGAAHSTRVEKVLLVASASIYPPDAAEPVREESLPAGPAEPDATPTTLAQRAAIATCQVYARQHGLRCACAVVGDIHGPGDDSSPETGQLLPALILRLHQARENRDERVVLPGSGKARCAFLHVDDLADACLFLMRRREDPSPINVGTGRALTMHELAGRVAEVIGYPGGISFDDRLPQHPAAPVLDVSAIRAAGWEPRIDLTAGIASTYRRYLESRSLAVRR